MPFADPESKRAYQRAYHAKNRERLREAERVRRLADPARASALDKAAYLRKDRAKVRARSRQRYAANKAKEAARKRIAHQRDYPKKAAAMRAYSKAYKAAHQEEIKARRRTYLVKNREQINARNRQRYADNPAPAAAARQKRRALKRGVTICDLTAAQWQAIKEAYDHRCVYCGRKMRRLTQDHLTPLSKGGNHTVSNVVPACQACNSKKNAGAVLRPVQPLLVTRAMPQKKAG